MRRIDNGSEGASWPLAHIGEVFDSLTESPVRASVCGILRIAHEQVRVRTGSVSPVAAGFILSGLVAPPDYIWDRTRWHSLVIEFVGWCLACHWFYTRANDKRLTSEIASIQSTAVDALEKVMEHKVGEMAPLEHEDHVRLCRLLIKTKRRRVALVALINAPGRVIEYPDL